MVRMPQTRLPGWRQQIAVSVPHSGTRSLVKYLNLTTHTHFLDRTMQSLRGDMVHIPIRNPMHVASSWAVRGKPLDNLIARYDSMFEFMSKYDYQLYRVEDIGRLAGTDDRKRQHNWRPKPEQMYRRAVLEQVVLPNIDFFRQFYGVTDMGDGQWLVESEVV